MFISDPHIKHVATNKDLSNQTIVKNTAKLREN